MTDVTDVAALSLDLGPLTRKEVKELRNGVGSGTQKIEAAVQEWLRAALAGGENPKRRIIPLVLLYKSPS